jgi:hypothetical protein
MSEKEQVLPEAGDYWELKLPGKRKRIKEVGRVDTKDFIAERGTYPEWKDKVVRLPYIHWARANKGRYTGITVRKLLEFGRRVSTKAERDAHLDSLIAKAKAKRDAEREAKGRP